ncbi:uncharacterized protein LOC129311511 [Prosopis cineraria]|uniref:uncharacterized protein LOC129311511 n=1 Tax=Prosopis cineraria TaxID=364024 RepID=UPI0024108E76|nr:uncharacterized protein LOC129311511 [Prosopis cineraria]
MAASIPTIKHHKLNAEPRKQDPSKFYYHFLYKALIVAIFLVPLFPSQAPEFINQSLVSRNWELLHLLLAGIAISYGVFCRRNDTTEKEINNSKFDAAQSYVSRFLQVSSFFEDDTESETHRHLVMTKAKSRLGVIISIVGMSLSLSLLLNTLILTSGLAKNLCLCRFGACESNSASVSVNGSGSKSGSRRFSRNAETEGSGRPTMEDRSKDNVVLPSPIPWRSESLMKLHNSRSSRPNSSISSSSPPLSSPKSKDQSLLSESLAKNSEDIVIKNKGFYKSSIPPPPPPPPMLFKSISMKPRNSSFNQSGSSDKDLKRSFTSERKDKSIGLFFENNKARLEAEEEEEQRKAMASVRFAEEEDNKVIMGFDEDDTESEDEGDDEAGRSRILKDRDCGREGPDVDKKADEFIAKFREQIRLQRIDSIKRSANRMARNLQGKPKKKKKPKGRGIKKATLEDNSLRY